MMGRGSWALLPIRLVSGWMFFSAFHRRVVLDPVKLMPDAPGYVGVKFNQFMPGAILGVGDLIGALLDRPGALFVFLWSFTIIEALVGLALLLGLGTRLASLGMLLLSAGILAGAGWLGPTCLDEWQIGALGIAGGATVMLGGAGPLSLDAWLVRRWPQLARAPSRVRQRPSLARSRHLVSSQPWQRIRYSMAVSGAPFTTTPYVLESTWSTGSSVPTAGSSSPWSEPWGQRRMELF